MTCAQAADSLFVDELGNVGIGTSSPTKKLQVEGVDDAAVLVKNTSMEGAERTMFILSNKGKTRFQLSNGANSWTFDNAGNRFQINKVGSGLPTEFEIYDNGDGYFGGDVYAKGVKLTSSRDRKTEFRPVDGNTILEQLAKLEVLSWRYKEDAKTERHIGPIAEDFQDVFAIGNGTHISTVDTNGIAFAAIKSLYDGAQKQATEVELLRAENAHLTAANAALEQRLQNLEDLVLQRDLVSIR
jgi:hypothetical protein